LDLLEDHHFLKTGYTPTTLPEWVLEFAPSFTSKDKRKKIEEIKSGDELCEEANLCYFKESEQERKWKGKQAQTTKANVRDLEEEVDELMREKMAILLEFKAVKEKERALVERGRVLYGVDLDLRVESTGGTLY
jgi:hypothetical protein